VTNIGAGKTVRLYKNGVNTGLTADTNASGLYSIDLSSLSIASGDILLAYLDDETENGVTVTKISGLVGFSGFDIYSDYLITRTETGIALTSVELQTADGTGIDVGSSTNDISAMYDPFVTGTTHILGNYYLPVGHTITFSGAVLTSEDAYIDGTMTL
jgi:hypothetical protein